MEIVVNYWAVLAAAAANVVLGMLWYGPLFGKKWMELTGMKPTEEDKKQMPKKTLIMFLTSFVMAYVLLHFTQPAESLNMALEWAVWLWLGFIATVSMAGVLWKGESNKLWALDNGYRLVALLMMTAILYSWV
jgi:multidrug transporter EmrE-like cation transporter